MFHKQGENASITKFEMLMFCLFCFVPNNVNVFVMIDNISDLKAQLCYFV